ncbi:thiol:disulfide interchange protein DsbA/DsbL [Shewanella sp. 202IG2-18]|uniref:thiol:disulfide interchange protein DsbA/DsbL n=1 Tax=Parashewanella hymeniacidonis TaxID=2807618 RepID=UPI001961FDE6|nr:thiol:disulfide interchange protein DsbA/DsbL [Parashewanella hymeniacidonis]MBM7071202.1 thiol:disulfide interchange protein DsbA/DsbL [Parashewanella hymeniacidonis]
MKKILLMAAALLLAPMLSQAATVYKEGVHYSVINQGPKTKTPEIKEYFSFLCPHCFQFYLNVLPKLEKQLPKGVKFTQSHVDFLGGDIGKDLTRAFAIAELLNVKHKIEGALFNDIHVKRQRILGMKDIRKIFIASGVDAKEFDSVVNSFAVNARVAQMARDAKDDQINGVPELVINGKYKVLKKEIKTWDDFINIAVWVAKNK